MSELTKNTILIVDDEPAVLDMLADYFQDDYVCLKAASGEEAITMTRRHPGIAAIILDIKMVPIDGVATAREIGRIQPDACILFHTAHAEYDEAQIDATIKPFDFIMKGRSLPRLRRSVRNAVQAYEYRANPAARSASVQSQYGLVGRSAKMQVVYEQIRQAAAADVKVLIRGETGTGKELVAKAIHLCSSRRDGRWSVFQGHRRSADLVASELFGYVRGSFTGAYFDRMGQFAYADGGTLFLDEIGDLDLDTQTKILRVLDTGEYQPVGSPEVHQTSVRLICATHKDLTKLVATGDFREDLFYRLMDLEITLPPLRDRREDIPLLVQFFADKYLRQNDFAPKQFEPAALDMLMAYDWPGNVRDLESCVKSLVLTSLSDLILATDVRRRLKDSTHEVTDASDTSLAARIRDFKRACIIDALDRHQNNVRQTARYLGLDPANLSRMLKELDIRRQTTSMPD